MKHVSRLLPAAIIVGALAAAAPASADTCVVGATPAPGQALGLFDPLGYYFDTDTVDASPSAGAITDYGTLNDSGSNGPGDTPAGPVSSDDAYDSWGNLFVGGVDAAHQYTSTDPDGCSLSADDRQLRFASVTVDGLQVQRTLRVPASDGSGVRILDAITNPGSTPVTTSVYVGDLTTADEGDVGSDGNTAVFASSDGTTTMTPASRWAITTDGRTSGSDPAIVHTWNGPGSGVERASLVQAGGPAVDDVAQTLSADQVGWAWQQVVIPAGKTATFLSFETLRATASTAAADQGAAAATAAASLQGESKAQVFDGLDAGQIASVRNWERPVATASIDAPSTAVTGQDVTFKAGGDLADGVPQCAAGTYAWTFGDGGTATGATVTHRFDAAGSRGVTLAASGACGNAATASATLDVSAPAVPVAAAPAPAPAAALAAPAPPVIIGFPKRNTVLRATLRLRGLRLRVLSGQTGTATVTVTGLGTELRATAKLSGGGKRGVAIRLSDKALAAAKVGKRLHVTVTVTGPRGTSTRTLTVRIRKA